MSDTRAVPLRVLFVAARQLPNLGGVEIHTHEVARRFAKVGADVTVISTDLVGRTATSEMRDGIRILRLPAWFSRGDYHFSPCLVKAMLEERWDIVNCVGYHTFTAPMAMLAARMTRTPYVVTLQSGGHSSWLRNALRGLHWAGLRPLLSGASALVAISEFEASYFSRNWRLPRDRFLVIPNGSDLPGLKSEGRGQRDEGLILSVGRLVQYKGHQRVIAALPQVIKCCPSARLLVVGTGPYEQELRRLAHRYGVSDRVDITSVDGTDRESMAQLLLRARLVTLLSEYESQGIAIMEAAALGCPVLVTETSALEEMLRLGYARGVPLAATSSQVSAAILAQLQQPLVPTHANLPTWSQCATRLQDLFLTIARPPRGGSHVG